MYLIPTSIAYDQIQDVDSYAAEQRGRRRERESLGWRGCDAPARRRYGDIYIRVRRAGLGGQRAVEAPSRPTEGDIDLQKLAFEVMVRINRVTPITAASLVTTTLLALQDRAASLSEITPSSTSWSPT